MNKKLNLVEILKDCPKGTKLYSPLAGEVEFYGIDYCDTNYPIKVLSNSELSFTKEGLLYVKEAKGECLLFPSKDQRDWSNFKPKKLKFDPKTLRPFDNVLVPDYDNIWKCAIFSHIEKGRTYPCSCTDSRFLYCIPYNNETKHLVGTTEKAPEFYRYWEE